MNGAQLKVVNLLKTFFLLISFLLLFVYLIRGPRQLFFFQCGPEMPKSWTPRLMPAFSLCDPFLRWFPQGEVSTTLPPATVEYSQRSGVCKLFREAPGRTCMQLLQPTTVVRKQAQTN